MKKPLTTSGGKKFTPGAAPRSGARIMLTTLAAGALTVIAVFAAFAVFVDYSSHRLRRAEIADSMTSVGRATAWGADNWVRQRVLLAEEISENLSMNFEGGDASPFLNNPIYENTFIWTYFGETDKSYHIWPFDVMPADYDPRTRPWYLDALSAAGPTLTEPYFDVSTMEETITVADPVVRDGELLGVVGADFSTAELSEVLRNTDFGEKGAAFLVTSDGKIIAHPDRDLISKRLSEVYRLDIPRIDGEIQYLNKLDTPKIVTFVPLQSLEGLDWFLALEVDKESAFHALHSMRFFAILATLFAALALVLVLGALIHRLLVQPLTAARKAADAANVAKSEFLASMSHEIRTPMNGVLGMAEVLMNTDLNHKQRELAKIIVSSGGALMTVINDILDFTKLETDKFKLAPRAFNLRQTVYEVATMMQARAVEKDLEMIVRYAPDLPEGVICDDSRLRQVLGNLIGNAVKFTEQGYVLVEVTGERRGDDGVFRFVVKDTGIGIAPADIGRMFEKFEQADSSHTRRFGGTGLGLAICKNIIGLMGGEISASSEVGVGSQFEFSLNLPIDDAIETMPQEPRRTLEGARILAVDDNAVNRRVLEELLQGWGMRSTLVSGHREAMAALEKADAEDDLYAAILMDYQMPEMNGAALAAQIQEDERFASAPVIILSSIDDAVTGRKDEGADIYEFLSKPVRPSQLLDTLVAALTKSSPHLLRQMIKPLNEKQSEAETGAGDPVVATTPAEDHRVKLLVAEDNIVNQMVIKNFIDASLFDVFIAANGEEAVSYVRKHAPAIIFMDLSMPVMDGFEASREIRKLEQEGGRARTPIVATTAHVLDEDRKKCTDAGMDDFLAKPINKQALDEVINRWSNVEAPVEKTG